MSIVHTSLSISKNADKSYWKKHLCRIVVSITRSSDITICLLIVLLLKPVKMPAEPSDNETR